MNSSDEGKCKYDGYDCWVYLSDDIMWNDLTCTELQCDRRLEPKE